VIPSVWRALPFVMLIFLAGLQAIPDELYEAAAIDGASAWNRFVHITLPMLKPLIAIQLLFNVIFSVYAFTIPATMFAGGTGFPYPGKHADLLFTAITRQTFGNTLYGAGAAVSTLLMLLMLVFVAVWYRSFRRSLALT
jgi:multiple sugar transport system permease protein